MDNLIFGIIVIILASIGYFYSWRFQKLDNYKIAILLLVVCGLILRLYTSVDFFLHFWDERYHALVAKNLIHHPWLPTLYDNPVLPYDYRNWTGNYIWLHKQPLPLWSMAASMWMFGVNEIALRLPSIVLSTLGIWLTFSIGKYLFSKKVGFLAAFFYSVNGLIIELTGGRVATDHIDIFFLFFIELAVFFSIQFIKRRNTLFNILAGVSIGAAILSKWLPALIVLPVWVLLVIDSGRFNTKSIVLQFGVILIACLVVFLPWQLYIFKMFPLEAKWEASLNLRHITEALDDQTGPFYYFLNTIRINYGELIYLPLLWFLWKTLKYPFNLKNLAIAIWFLVPFLFFSFVKTKMQAYILFASPALFLMTSDFFFALFDYKKDHKPKWLFNLILFLLIALPIRYMIERVKPFERTDRSPQWVDDLKKFSDRKISNGILFNYDNPVEAMFYTNLAVYQDIPDKKTIDELVNEGYTVLINDKGNIPDNIKGLKIKIVNLETSKQ